MRLPTGPLAALLKRFPLGDRPLLIGTAGFEPRSLAVLKSLQPGQRRRATCTFVRVLPEPNTFPDYSVQLNKLMDDTEADLLRRAPGAQVLRIRLLANEDELLDLTSSLVENQAPSTVLLDISAMPKRVFCFILAFLVRRRLSNVIATYTPVPLGGYNRGRLAEDPMAPGFLPGFGGESSNENVDLVLSAGFESLGGSQVIEDYLSTGTLRVIMPFPPHATTLRRTWEMLRSLLRDQPSAVRSDSVVAISAMDAERTFDQLKRWRDENGGLLLAPFGPKPHSLAMALYCLHDRSASMLYTQPRSYNPTYSIGAEDPVGYVVSWDGVHCYER